MPESTGQSRKGLARKRLAKASGLSPSSPAQMKPLSVDATVKLAIEHHQAGRSADAETLYREILRWDSRSFDALLGLGVLAEQVGSHEVAAGLLRQAVALEPGVAEAHGNLGVALEHLGRMEEALEAHQNAVRLDPRSEVNHYNLANAAKGLGRMEEAIAGYRQAISLRPDYAEAWCNLGAALLGQQLEDEARAACARALELRSDYPEAQYNLGLALHGLGRIDEALAACRSAIVSQPNYATAHYGLGNILQTERRYGEAVDCFHRCLDLVPRHALALNNLAACHKEMGRISEALEGYRAATEAEPLVAKWRSNFIYTMHFDPAFTAVDILNECREWNRRHAAELTARAEPHRNNRDPHRRLRIGYVSPDFRQHVVGYNLLPFFREHDRESFEIYGYSNVALADGLTAEIRLASDRWRDISRISDDEAARLIRGDEIDILVDLTSHMAENRLLLLARKPAPIQVTYLAYCTTTGLDAMDYRFSDPYLDPLDGDLECYSEETIRLPHSYWCYQSIGAMPEVTSVPAAESGFVTFGCLNNLAKVSPGALDLWSRILLAVPQSRLLMQAPRDAREVLRSRFASNGVAAERIDFVDFQPWGEYVASNGKLDIALDPFPYGGGITSLDAIWMGVPVITLSGGTAVSRAGRSILSNIGVPELIAQTADRYFDIAVGLAKDLPRLTKLRANLRGRMERSPLRNPKAHAGAIEAAYREMWRNWVARSG